MRIARLLLLLVAAWLVSGTILPAQEFNEKFEHWPLHCKINGTIIIDNGVGTTKSFQSLFRRAEGKKATIFFHGKIKLAETIRITEAFREAKAEIAFGQVDGAGDRPYDQALESQDVVGIYFGEASGVDDHHRLQKAAEQLSKFVEKGGTLLLDGEAAKSIAQFSVDQESGKATKGTGLFPDTALMINYEFGKTDQGKLLSLLATQPRTVGMGLEPKSGIVLSGRKIRVLGEGKATFVLMANERQPLRIQTIGAMESQRRPASEWLVDLTEWRRDAIDRTLDPFPPAKPEKPFVENGTLVIVGGGGMPRGLMEQMVEMAGGKEKAKMVYVPCSERDDVGERQRTVEMWNRMGVKHATFIHTKDRTKANEDQDFLEPLKDATGIWFGGGRQWNFADSYYGTEAHRLMKEVLKRGGVIGGSSAGASIQARYLARATPIGNFDIMAPGYERGGLGFISGVAIDQHFSQRGRQKDMTQLVNRYPQMLGIGLDEATAIIVRKSQATVVGRGKVFFYNRQQPVYPGRPDYVALPAGSQYDLAERKVIKDATRKDTKDDSENAKKSKNDGH